MTNDTPYWKETLSAKPDVPDTNVGDTIYRQAAIDAVEKLDIPEDMCVFEILSHIELAITTLPSAQPEIIYCKDCNHRIVNEHFGEKGYINLKAYCELDTGDPFELGREAHEDDWFCADAERRTDE